MTLGTLLVYSKAVKKSCINGILENLIDLSDPMIRYITSYFWFTYFILSIDLSMHLSFSVYSLRS